MMEQPFVNNVLLTETTIQLTVLAKTVLMKMLMVSVKYVTKSFVTLVKLMKPLVLYVMKKEFKTHQIVIVLQENMN